jgi:hypothetical protein
MRKKVLAPVLIMMFLVSATMTFQVVKVSANFLRLPSPAPSLIISIESPIGGGRYAQDYVILSCTLKFPNWPGSNSVYPHGDITFVSCSVDGQYYANLDHESGMCYSAVVKGLSDGWHKIKVTASCEHLSEGSAFVLFYVDTVAPSISVISPLNETYTTTDLPLNFTVSEAPKWIGYSLDGQRNTTLAENITLSELTFGSHSLTVYANDTVGHLAISETIYFTITNETEEIPAGQPEPFPTFLVATVSVVPLVAVAAAILVYFKKTQRSNRS